MTAHARDDEPDSPVSAALELVQSDDWRDRVSAVKVLSKHIDDPQAHTQLVRSLDDVNSAVGAATAHALVKNAGMFGLHDVLHQLAFGADDVGYFVSDQLVKLWAAGFPVISMLKEYIDKEPAGPVRDEAVEALRQLNGS